MQVTVGEAWPRVGGAGPAATTPEPAAGIVAVVIAAVSGLSLWYLTWPQVLLAQGGADGTRVDIAARVDGRVARLPVMRGQDVAAGTVLVGIDNPELVARRDEARAKAVADAGLARIDAGTRAEVVAQRRAEIDRGAAALTLAQQTYDRVRPLVANGVAPGEGPVPRQLGLQVREGYVARHGSRCLGGDRGEHALTALAHHRPTG
jgi:HlyD family secretion protein